MTPNSGCPLTPKQLEVVNWLSHGKTARETAELCGRSLFTVQRHIIAARERTGTVNTPALVAAAIRKGWIQ